MSSRKADGPEVVAIPAVWLRALILLFVAPWVVAAALYLWPDPPGPDAPPAPPTIEAGHGTDTRMANGPWGALTVVPVVVSPPLEYVSTDFGAVAAPEWRFPSATLAQLDAFLATAGLSPDQSASLRRGASPEPRIKGVVVRPDPAFVRALPPEVRARIYTQLARTPLNAAQAHSYRFVGPSTETWFSGSAISPATRRLVEPLVYRDDAILHFADLDLIRPLVTDGDELRRLVKTLHRQSTVLARLSVADERDVRPLAEYWGRGGRRTDLHPLLESIAGLGPDRSIDLVHLLPMFARNHLYRYPKITAADLDRPVIANCLWSSLNFFSDEPQDRFLDVPVALATLKRDYYVIEDRFQLGDIVVFLDEEGDLFHAAVHLADRFVFTKNGTSPMAPWTIMSVDDVLGYYRARSAAPRLIYHRRNDL